MKTTQEERDRLCGHIAKLHSAAADELLAWLLQERDELETQRDEALARAERYESVANPAKVAVECMAERDALRAGCSYLHRVWRRVQEGRHARDVANRVARNRRLNSVQPRVRGARERRSQGSIREGDERA